MKFLYHGTSFESYLSIMANGFNPAMAKRKTWSVSSEQYMYFFSEDKVEEYDDCEIKDTIDCEYDGRYETEIIDKVVEQKCIQYALQNGIVGAAIQESRYNTLVVFKLKVNDEICEDDDDEGGLEWVADRIDTRDLSLDMIEEVFFVPKLYYPRFKEAYYIRLMGNIYLNNKVSKISNEERKLLYAKSNKYWDDLHEIISESKFKRFKLEEIRRVA